MQKERKSGFLFKYLFRGIIGLLVIILIFILLKDNPYLKNSDWLNSLSGREWLVYLIFSGSEIIFGLIPPEFFMIWSLHHGISDFYTVNVLFLSVLSLSAGILGYYIGSYFSKTIIFQRFYNRFLQQYEAPLKRYSGFILFVGAVTPLPFSAMCMLVGTIKYPPKKFYLISLTRFLRFGIYGYLIWQVNAI